MAQQHPHRAKGMPREQGNAALTTASPTDHTVRYKSFINILLNFQLKGHEKFLSKFLGKFRAFDDDANGVLDEAQFRQFVRAVSPAKANEALDALVNAVDPYNNQHITFSDAVAAMSADLVSKITAPPQ